MRHSKGWARQRQKESKKRELVTDKTMICGLDLTRKRHAFHVLNGGRESVARGKIPHTLEGIEELITKLGTLRREHSCDRIVFFMEGASHFWMPVASLLSRKGYAYRLLHQTLEQAAAHLA